MLHTLTPTEIPFDEILFRKKVICYFQVGWSGPEAVSRTIVSKILEELGPSDVPVFSIDCSGNESVKIETWLLSQRHEVPDFTFGGWGEMCYLKNGRIVDFISNPTTLGREKTKATLISWMF